MAWQGPRRHLKRSKKNFFFRSIILAFFFVSLRKTKFCFLLSLARKAEWGKNLFGNIWRIMFCHLTSLLPSIIDRSYCITYTLFLPTNTHTETTAINSPVASVAQHSLHVWANFSFLLKHFGSFLVLIGGMGKTTSGRKEVLWPIERHLTLGNKRGLLLV